MEDDDDEEGSEERVTGYDEGDADHCWHSAKCLHNQEGNESSTYTQSGR